MPANRPLAQNKSRRKPTPRPGQRWPGRLLIALGGLMLLGALAWGLWPRAANADFKPAVSGAAALRTDREKIDLGDVHLGQTVSASFQLTNVGDRSLHFTQAPYIQVVEGC